MPQAPATHTLPSQGHRSSHQLPGSWLETLPLSPVPFQTKIFPSLPWSRMKQSSDLKAPWAKGFSSATRETDMVPAPLETWGDEGREAQNVSDLYHFGLPRQHPPADTWVGPHPSCHPKQHGTVTPGPASPSSEAHSGFLSPSLFCRNHICDPHTRVTWRLHTEREGGWDAGGTGENWPRRQSISVKEKKKSRKI